MNDGAAMLGVERSLLGKRWRARLEDSMAGLSLAQAIEAPELVGRVLAARGIAAEDAPDYLDPTLRRLLPDPLHLLDMKRAIARLAGALEAGEKIAIFGDYDVDGATSAALLSRFLEAVADPPTIYIPDRLREGYGPNATAMRILAAQDVRVVITVDCGISAFDALADAADAGLDVIVVDHHVAEARLPQACAVIDPNRLDDTSPHRQLAAVGVAFLLVVGLNRHLREAGWYRERAEPDLLQWLDLVALGTVCDVVPLTGVNRAFVRQGLTMMRQRRNVGLRALGDVAGLEEPPGVYHLGFILGPRVNAGGRVGEASLGARLLTTEEDDKAREIAQHLDALNRERQAIEQAVLEEAIEQVETADGGTPASAPLVLAHEERWHAGVIGIVASRLKERYNRPAVVVAWEDGADGIGKASCRSVPGVDIGAAITAARQAGLLVNGGGHPMAAGFTVERAKLSPLEDFLHHRLGTDADEAARIHTLGLDGALGVEGATAELLEMLETAGPYGAGNPEPRFAVAGAQLLRADIVGRGHVRCQLAGRSGKRLKAIAFRAADNTLGHALLAGTEHPFHLAGRLRLDRRRGTRAVELHIDDGAPAPPPSP
ncbi:MAG: single-stranded-DNA-specific exonuclease RecJ [Rhodospirillaceae bacterium]|nr:single-stranded-DNA-specific exonuclease RecJ [Rhodospirillaceae bacterium]